MGWSLGSSGGGELARTSMAGSEATLLCTVLSGVAHGEGAADAFTGDNPVLGGRSHALLGGASTVCPFSVVD